MDHLRRLLIAAVDERTGYQVGSDELIRMALDALVGGVDTPALRELAGLTRDEEPEAHELFEQIVHELGLAPSLPDPVDSWVLVRWWCQLIVSGEITPEEGGRRIWMESSELGYPDALMSLVGDIVQLDDWPAGIDPPADFRKRIVAQARQLLEQPWPPPATRG
ncbi:MAG: hypothetical protein ACRDSK_03935 [Actinophytocola sp.]|uniref:hypothetical protein n=1 Tax=Actinophytocola sp. TaxID=1872138 RepID=UPI003D6A6908